MYLLRQALFQFVVTSPVVASCWLEDQLIQRHSQLVTWWCMSMTMVDPGPGLVDQSWTLEEDLEP